MAVCRKLGGKGSKVRFRKIRRGGKRRKMSKNITLYCVNINGLKSKLPSLLGLIDKHKYDVVFLSETKVYLKNSVKIPGYQLYPVTRSSRKGGGLLIAVKHSLCSSVLVDEGDNADFLTVKLLLPDNNVRLILVYGPQEDASEVEKSMFYDRVTYQIEREKLVGESVILIGDFNAKLGKDLIKNDIRDMSKNRKLLYQLYTNAELELLNSGDKCKGVFTGINNKNCFEKSVLDYAFCSPSLISYIESLNIDEMKCETPSRVLKRGERPSDHCAMTTKMNVPNRQHISKEKSNTMWNFQDKKVGKSLEP